MAANQLGSQDEYVIKKIDFFGSSRCILLQSRNGPCPLLAIANVLLLKNEITLERDTGSISFEHLIQRLGNVMLDKDTGADPGNSGRQLEIVANFRQNIHEVLAILPKLNEGLDVNVRFNSPDGFEYTPELAVFDLFDVPILHGWIIDPQDRMAFPLMGHLTYNQAIERLIACDDLQSKLQSAAPCPAAAEQAEQETDEQRQITEGLVIKEWLDAAASQFTYDGLVQVHGWVKERQLCAFFRNNHFCTLFKKDGDLYLLATDIAFEPPSPVVWEKLDEVDGDTGGYFTGGFEAVTAATVASAGRSGRALQQETWAESAPRTHASEDYDYHLALQTQYELNEASRAVPVQLEATPSTATLAQPAVQRPPVEAVAAARGARGYVAPAGAPQAGRPQPVASPATPTSGSGVDEAPAPAPAPEASLKKSKACSIQ